MATSISKSPCLRKRSINCPVLGEWTCFKRREDLMVLLADVARIDDKSPLKDCSSFSMNTFMTLWDQVGYLLSNTEEQLIETSTTKDHMRLLPYDDALEFVTQHLARPGKLILKIFDPRIQGKHRPVTETVILEPLEDEDGGENYREAMDRRKRLRVNTKRDESSLNDSSGSEGNGKTRKISNSDESDPASNNDEIFLESFLAFTKTFLGKKQCEKDRLLEQLEEEKQERKNAEERMNELKVQFTQQLEEEKKLRKIKEETVKALRDELQVTNRKKRALEDKLQGIKQFLQVDSDKGIEVIS